MRALLITVGSRGDAEPFQALTDALTAMGHAVELFLQPDHDFVPVGMDIYQQQIDEAKPELLGEAVAPVRLVHIHPLPFITTDFYKHTANPRHGKDSDIPRVKTVGVISEVICQLVLPCLKDVLKVAENCDLLVSSSLARHMCFCIGKALQKPVGLLHLSPMAPTKAFPHYSSEDAVECILKGAASDANEETYWMLEQYNFDFLKEDLEKVVAETLGAAGMLSFEEFRSRFGGSCDMVHSFNCFSTDLFPAIVAGNIHEVGALADAYLPAPFVEPPAVGRFLEELKGTAPVAIGFGSMPFGQAPAVIEALEALQCPAVLVGAALGKFEANEWTKKHILQLDNVAYPWLLPKCRCMVSHGGAGVLHSTLRAGIPAVVAPLIGDQFAFAKLVDARELGVNAGPMNALTADGLIGSLKKILEDPLGARCMANAQEFAAKIKDKDSALQVVKYLEEMTCSRG